MKKNIDPKKRARILSLLILSCLSLLTVQAQENDFAVWSTFGVKHKFTPALTVGGNLEFRTKDHLKETDRWGIALNGSYQLSRIFKAEAGYEFHYRNRDAQGWKIRQRYSFGLAASMKWTNFRFSLRERFQQTWSQEKNELHLRSLLKVGYVPSKGIVSPYGSLEFYNSLNGNPFFDLSRVRYRAGTEWKLSQKWGIDTYFLYQKEGSKNKYVLGLDFVLSL